jgi:hypothetical protein
MSIVIEPFAFAQIGEGRAAARAMAKAMGAPQAMQVRLASALASATAVSKELVWDMNRLSEWWQRERILGEQRFTIRTIGGQFRPTPEGRNRRAIVS